MRGEVNTAKKDANLMTASDPNLARPYAACPGSRLEWETIMPGPEEVLLSAFLRCRADPADADAWERLLTHFSGHLRRITARVARQYGCNSHEDHLDLMQDVCLKISRSIRLVPEAALGSEESITAYLKALTVNEVRDILRARFSRKRGEWATVRLDDRLDVLASELHWQSLERPTLLRQVDALLGCPTRDRAVFWLYYRQGLTAKEISLIPSLQLSSKGVESLLHRLIESLRRRLRQEQSQGPAKGTRD